MAADQRSPPTGLEIPSDGHDNQRSPAPSPTTSQPPYRMDGSFLEAKDFDEEYSENLNAKEVEFATEYDDDLHLTYGSFLERPKTETLEVWFLSRTSLISQIIVLLYIS